MTWNSSCMSGPKRDLLTVYKLNNQIDFIFLQEAMPVSTTPSRRAESRLA